LVALAACGDHAATSDAAVPADALPPAQLLAYYPMDNDPNIEGMIDLGGHHLDGNCSINQCPTLVTGRFGMAYHFDGVSQHIRIPDNGAFTLPHGFSVAAWVKQDAVRMDTLFAKPLTGHGESWQLDVQGGNAIVLCTTHSGVDTCWTGGVDATTNWVFVAFAWTPHRQEVYGNGLDRVWMDNTQTDFDTSLVSIGADIENGVLVTPLQGALDQLRIYDGALDINALAALAGEM
jgi:hypothetical protein